MKILGTVASWQTRFAAHHPGILLTDWQAFHHISGNATKDCCDSAIGRSDFSTIQNLRNQLYVPIHKNFLVQRLAIHFKKTPRTNGTKSLRREGYSPRRKHTTGH